MKELPVVFYKLTRR